MSEVVQTYTLQILADEKVPEGFRVKKGTGELVSIHAGGRHLNVIVALNEMEQNLTDLLPDGYQARISEWDAP